MKMKDENMTRLIIGFVLIIATIFAIVLSGIIRNHLGLAVDDVVSIPVKEYNVILNLSILIIGICGAMAVAVLLTMEND